MEYGRSFNVVFPTIKNISTYFKLKEFMSCYGSSFTFFDLPQKEQVSVRRRFTLGKESFYQYN